MSIHSLARPLVHLAVVSLAWLAVGPPLAAEEPAPANTTQVVSQLDGVLTTTLALNAIHLATSSDLIGADVAQVDGVLRSHLGLGEGKGLVVTGVGNDTPAARAGLSKNDVLITAGNEEIIGAEGLRKLLESSAEKPISLGVIRGGKKQSIDVTPRSTAANFLVEPIQQAAGEPKYWLGVGLAAADDTLRSQLALPAREGLVVTNVENDSPAIKAGVMVNDVLLKLDGKGLTTIETLSEQLQTIADKPATLELLRRGKPATLTVTAEKRSDWSQVLYFNEGFHNVILFAPQELGNVFAGSANTAGSSGTFTHPPANLVQQIGELEAQVKQLEASLAALRTAIELASQPAQRIEKKE